MAWYKLIILNDLDLPIRYDVFVNGNRYIGDVKNGKSQYYFTGQAGSYIKIYKENKWAIESKSEAVAQYLISFIDALFGNSVCDGDKLPVGTEMQVKLGEEKEIQLSNILNATPSGIERWTKGAHIQFVVLAIVILFITAVLFLIVPFPVRIMVGILGVAGLVFLLFKASERLLIIKSLLEKYLQT